MAIVNILKMVKIRRKKLYPAFLFPFSIVEKIWNVNVNCVKVNGAQNIGQGHWVNVPAKSGGQGDVSCKV